MMMIEIKTKVSVFFENVILLGSLPAFEKDQVKLYYINIDEINYQIVSDIEVL